MDVEAVQNGALVLPKTIDFTVDYLRTGLPRDAYARAQALQLKRKKSDADRAAQTAEALAALATAQARQRKLAEQIEGKISENNALRRDLLLGKGGDRP